VTSTEEANDSDNILIFQNAASSLNLPGSTTLTASFDSGESIASVQWFVRTLPDGTYSPVPGADQATLTVNAGDDVHEEYLAVLTDVEGCTNEASVKVFSINVSCGNNTNKVLICHVPPGNPNKAKNICVNVNAVPAILGNSNSYLGSCDLDYKTDGNADDVTVNLFPNPTSNGNFRLQYTSAEKKARFVYVYDAQGRTVQSVNVGEYPQTFEIEMSLPSQANGIYFVQIAGDGEILAKEKIMIAR
ncbi:MAG: T9SS type A sorting domain-containing protein, partial [Flavobacteriales bacterium]|nr:T9SS type A sorting domain-containing protein [Flavobacteriales bacterium]